MYFEGISESDKSHHEILRFDRRACRPDYLLFLHKCETIRQLRCASNIAMRKSAQTFNITASQVQNKQFIDNAVRKDNAYRFMSAIVGSPAYWEEQKKKVLAMVRQFGIFTLFITLTAAETKWYELIVILKKVVDKEDISLADAETLTFEEISRLIRSDPVTCARYFDHRFKELKKTWFKCNDGPFGKYKIIHMFYRIEFQHRGSPHVHMVIWLENAPQYEVGNIESEKAVIDFIDSIITTDSDDPEIATDIGKQYHKCSHTCFKGDRQKCRFNAPFRPMDSTRILMPLSHDEKENLTKEEKSKIRKFNEQLDNELNHNGANIQTFDNLLTKMGVTLEFYLLATRVNINHPKVFVKREPKNCRINAYCKKILSLMRSNMDIQFVLDAYACIGYIVDYINKSARGLSRLLRQCIEDHRKGNKTIAEQMKALCHILYNSTEVCAQEAAWARLRLPMCASSVIVEFINTSPSQSRQRILKSNAMLKKLPPDSTDIYKKGALDRYSLRPDEMEELCLADVCAKFTFSNKEGKTSIDDEDGEENNELTNELIEDMNAEIDEESTSTALQAKGRKKLKRFTLKDNSGIFIERRQPKVIRYCRFSYHKDEDNFFREMCLLFLPWRNEKSEIEDKNCKEIYSNNEAIIKMNFCKYNATEIDFEAITREIEENRAAEEQEQLRHASENENGENEDANQPFLNVFDYDDNVIQPNAAQEMGLEASGIDLVRKYSVPGILQDEAYLTLMDSLNEEQRDIIMHVNSCIKDKQVPFHIFITGGAGSGKSQTIKALYQSLTRHFRSKPSDEITSEILIVSFTGMAAHNVDGMTAHSAFHLSAGRGERFARLKPDMKNTLRCQLFNLKVLIIDEISMLSSNHLDQISTRLGEIFETQPDVQFGGISVIVCGDFNQLPPVGAPYAFAPKSGQTTAALMINNPQWQLFKLFRLTRIMRQRDDLIFTEALNRLAVGQCTSEDVQLFNSRCFKEEDLPERAQRATRLFEFYSNIDVYNQLTVDKIKPQAKFNISNKAVDHLIGVYSRTQRDQAYHALSKMKTRDAQNLPSELDLVENVRYMVTTNVNVQDGLYNGALGTLKFIEFENNKAQAIYLDFDSSDIGSEARAARKRIMDLNKINPKWTPIFRVKKQFNVLAKGTVQVSREQYPLQIAESRSIHKSQGLTQDTIVLDTCGRNLTRQKLYTALSRARTLDGVFIVGKFVPPSAPTSNDLVTREIARMEQTCLLTPKFMNLRIRSEINCIQIISHNVQSLKRHLSSIANDKTYVNSDFLLFQETWLRTSDTVLIENFVELTKNPSSTATAQGTIIYGKCNNKFVTSGVPATNKRAGSCHIEITAIDIDCSLLILNVYKNPTCTNELFIEAMESYENLISRYQNVLVMGDFNVDLKNGSAFNNFMDMKYQLKLISHQNSTTKDDTCIDGVFGKMLDFKVDCKVYFTYFSHHYPLVINLIKK